MLLSILSASDDIIRRYQQNIPHYFVKLVNQMKVKKYPLKLIRFKGNHFQSKTQMLGIETSINQLGNYKKQTKFKKGTKRYTQVSTSIIYHQ